MHITTLEGVRHSMTSYLEMCLVSDSTGPDNIWGMNVKQSVLLLWLTITPWNVGIKQGLEQFNHQSHVHYHTRGHQTLNDIIFRNVFSFKLHQTGQHMKYER